MKEDCEIIKDLLPNYIEKLVNRRTKEYIEEHITICNDCRQTLQIMKENKILDDKQNNKEDKIELDHLKKCRRKMIIPRILAVIFGTIIFVILAVMFYKFLNKYQTFNNIINKAQTSKQKIENADNYSIYKISIHKDYNSKQEEIWYDEYYYKDGKYKEINFRNNSVNFSEINPFKREEKDNNLVIKYMSPDIEKQIYIYTEAKKIEQEVLDEEEYLKIISGNDLLFAKLDPYIKLKELNNDILCKAGFVKEHSIREDRFKGIECYVLTIDDSNGYDEIWIDKETYITVREIRDRYGISYNEEIIMLNLGNITDDVVEFNEKEYSNYTIINK